MLHVESRHHFTMSKERVIDLGSLIYRMSKSKDSGHTFLYLPRPNLCGQSGKCFGRRTLLVEVNIYRSLVFPLSDEWTS